MSSPKEPENKTKTSPLLWLHMGQMLSSIKNQEDVLPAVKGLQAYLKAQVPARVDGKLFWQEGEVSLRVYEPEKQNKYPPVIFIPSIINRSTLFDLHPQKSLLRWFLAKGFKVYQLDWGTPVNDSGLSDMAALVHTRLIPAFDAVYAQEKRKLSLVNYCLGGLLALPLAAERQDLIARMAFLATPWDFSIPHDEIAERARTQKGTIAQLVNEQGKVPFSFLQMFFMGGGENIYLKKFSLLDKSPKGIQAEIFVALENWVNDRVDMPGPLALEVVTEFYENNKTMYGTWQVGDKSVNAAALHIPSLIIAPMQDKIVIPRSAAALGHMMPQATIYKPFCGHTGLVAGRRAERTIWPRLTRFFATQTDI
ncbi:MAG: hypothetical protein GC136_05595 [Alphaproteobacteria bacterium]|nr:hypothetical protein [Alphaproteobacteria bacterium]